MNLLILTSIALVRTVEFGAKPVRVIALVSLAAADIELTPIPESARAVMLRPASSRLVTAVLGIKVFSFLVRGESKKMLSSLFSGRNLKREAHQARLND
jgi:hypothetical protein